jgi:chromosome segregation ATPase
MSEDTEAGLVSTNVVARNQEPKEDHLAIKKSFLLKYEKYYNEAGALRADVEEQKALINGLNQRIDSIRKEAEASYQRSETSLRVKDNALAGCHRDLEEKVSEISRLRQQNTVLSTDLSASLERLSSLQKATEMGTDLTRRLEEEAHSLEEQKKELQGKIVLLSKDIERHIGEKDELQQLGLQLEKEKQAIISQTTEVNKRFLELSRALELEFSHEIRILKEFESVQIAAIKLEGKYNNIIKSPLGRLNLFIWRIYNKISAGK